MSKKIKKQKKGGNKKELIELITAIIELIIAVLTLIILLGDYFN